jgi:hypothetical protein
MSFDYVRRFYGVPAKRGGRVLVTESNGAKFYGTITRATHYVFVRIDGEKHARPYHPEDVEYMTPLCHERPVSP